MNKFDINDLTGLMLISTPKIQNNPLFANAIVLITQHKANKAAEGVILNKPTKLAFHKLISMTNVSTEIKLSKDVLQNNMILIGGPELPQKTFLLNSQGLQPLTENVLDELILCETSNKFEVFAGICVWPAGQLEKEILADMWLITDSDTDYLFNTPYPNRYLGLVNKLELSAYFQRMIGDSL